jgi:hypothetical protein
MGIFLFKKVLILLCVKPSRLSFMRIGPTLKTQLVANKLHARSPKKKKRCNKHENRTWFFLLQ